MAIEFKKSSYSGHFPEIWRGECKILPGGFKPVQQLDNGTVLRRATPLYVDFDTKTAAVCKTATVLSGGTTSAVRVAKGHYFCAGDNIGKHAATIAASALISSVDRSNDDYDVLKLATALTGLAADDVIVETKSKTVDSNTTYSVAYAPNMIVGADTHFDGKGIPTIDAAYDAVVLSTSLTQPMLAEWLNGVCLKANPNIIYIKQ